jgi:Tol biopolymer transport system component
LKQLKLASWDGGGQYPDAAGILVLDDLGDPSIPCYFLDLLTREINPIDTSISCYSVSPDRLRVTGYGDGSENGLVLEVINNNGELLSSEEYRDSWGPLIGWINNDFVMMVSREATVNAVFYNPRNKTEIKVAEQFPNWHYGEPIDVTRSSGATGIFYSPQTDYVVYQTRPENVDMWYYSFALYDRKNQREIARVPLGYPLFPQWSPNGREAIVAAFRDYTGAPSPGRLSPDELSVEIFSMSIDGTVEQITNLGRQFQEYKIYDLSWSPDGTRLAFLFENEEDSHPCYEKCIVIVDLSTLTMTIYTMPGGYYVKVSSWVDTIIWSPQGDQLLLPAENDNPNLAMIFDIDDEIVFGVARNARIIGWMKATP